MMTKQQPESDGGFSLIELLLVILVVGILATIVVASVGGFTAEAESTGCDADARNLQVATEAFFADERAISIPPTGTSADAFEQTLVDGGFLRHVSSRYNLDDDGDLVAVPGSPCGV